jgi:two-component system cell cycle sensor histidine kinase/response regulator CckA
MSDLIFGQPPAGSPRRRAGDRDALVHVLHAAAREVGGNVAFLSQVVAGTPRGLRVIAAGGPAVPACLQNRSAHVYAPDGSPCGMVLREGSAFHPAGVLRSFPSAQLLAEAGLDAYAGVLLRDPTGAPFGVLAVANSAPFPRDPSPCPRLRPFATRAEALLVGHQSPAARSDSEECYRVLAQHSPLGIWQIDIEGRTLYANPVMCALLEVDGPAALESRRHREFFPEESLAVMAGEHEKRRQGIASSYEVELVGAKGTRRRVTIHGGPIIDSEGRLKSLIGTFADVTEERRAQEARRRMDARIQQGQRLESLGVLAGGIAHDFNNLLTGVLGNASLALLRLDHDSPARPLVERIEESAQRAADLTRQMLAYAGKGRTRVETSDLSDLVREMEPLLRASVSKKARLLFRLSEELPPVACDVEQVRQVVMNLAMNASDAIAEHEGTIALTTRVNDTDDDPDLPPGGHVVIEVADDGCGMDALTQQRIFDPFFSTKAAGRGLGLSAVHGIMRTHGGVIRVDSRPGSGSTIRVLFPRSVSVAPANRPLPPATVSGASGTVLVVDDEDVVLGVSKMALEDAGYRVLTASDGAEGVEAVREHGREIDLVFLDLTMPRMSGEEALVEMRRLEPRLRVVLCSGYSEQEVAGPEISRDLAGFLQKPFRAGDLLEKARAVLVG